MRPGPLAIVLLFLALVPLRSWGVVTAGPPPPGGKLGYGPSKAILPPLRPGMPPSLQGRKLVAAPGRSTGVDRGKGSATCDEPLVCADFGAAQERIWAWFGFPYQDNGIDFFIATRGQAVVDLGGGRYGTQAWDRRHFFVETRSNGVPDVLQARFIGTDENTGHEFLAADYVGYRLPDTDYTDFELGMSISTLVIEFDPATERFVDFYVEYYDENGQYTGENYALEAGDEFLSFFVGFEETEPDVVYLFYIEDIAPVEIAPVFHFVEQYPGRDFSCALCPPGLDLANTQYFYLFEAYTEDAFAYTEPVPYGPARPERLLVNGFEGTAAR